MKKSKDLSLYQVAKSALEKIAGKTLLQYTEEYKASEQEKMLSELSARLNASIQAQMQAMMQAQKQEQMPQSDDKAKKVVAVKPTEKVENPVEQLANRTLGMGFEVKDKSTSQSTEEEKEPKIDYQKTLSVVQALAQITLEMLENMEN